MNITSRFLPGARRPPAAGIRHPWIGPRRPRLRLGLLLVLTLLASSLLCFARPPNFVIILADDLGYGDLGCYVHPSIRTPNLDRMAAEGLRFTDFYSTAEVCTPSRAALLTGRYPVRSGMCGEKRRVLWTFAQSGLPQEEITLAEALQARGYATAHIGKWHLGRLPQFNPTRHGFDRHFGLPHSNDMTSRTNLPPGEVASLNPRNEFFEVPLRRNDTVIETVPDQSTLTRRYTEESLQFIRENRQRPFLLYLAHTFPHVPLFASPAFRAKSPRGLYGDVVEELDGSVGHILEALRREGLERNTLVLFTSDNGPWLTQKLAGGSAGLLRDGKGSTYEGGMRVPCIVRWPGKIKPGSVTRELACQLDLFPTCLALAGVPLPRDRAIDGFDLAPLLFEGRPSPRQVFFYYRGTQLYAARQGPYKAHFVTRAAYGKDEPQRHDPPLLFHLGHDPSERFDIATNHLEVLADIARAVERHRAQLTVAKSQLDE